MNLPPRSRKRASEDELDKSSKAGSDRDLREQQHRKRPMMSSPSHRDGEELSRNISRESLGRQNSGTPVPGNHALQSYQVQPILLEQQNEKRLHAANTSEEDQDTALRTITSLPDQLNTTHISIKELLENLPTYFRNIEQFKDAISAAIQDLQENEKDLTKKQAEIKALENAYNELIPMTPFGLQREHQELKDRTMHTMLQDWERLKMKGDKAREELEERKKKLAGSEKALERARELVPEMIKNLIKLAPTLREVNVQIYCQHQDP